MSPDCGHLYELAADYKGSATATWTIAWTAPALGDSGTLTETRCTPFTVPAVGVQAFN
ncbi:hypothetical protein ACFQ8C_23715 [Streptomyces sp. NPDC056503]|uniref:hypothetical protein n=1 Tax=Streptomyces sp. NPDC056503 TaxID=3345842 RepID=UPI00367C272B